jgi:hypothetical protein
MAVMEVEATGSDTVLKRKLFLLEIDIKQPTKYTRRSLTQNAIRREARQASESDLVR